MQSLFGAVEVAFQIHEKCVAGQGVFYGPARSAMDILIYPDPRLRQPCTPVESFDAELAATARAMFEVMYRTEGVGLAAPQVGISQRLLVYNPEGTAEKPEQEVVLANPKIVRKSRDKELGEEGCLSFPNIFGKVERPLTVSIEAQGLEGEPVKLDLEGWSARIFLHEFDHLEGILFTDRMTPVDKDRVKSQLKELEAKFAESGSRTKA